METLINNIRIILLNELAFAPHQGIQGIDTASAKIATCIIEAIRHHIQYDVPHPTAPAPNHQQHTFTFSTTDQLTALRYLQANDMASAIWEIVQHLRNGVKYHSEDSRLDIYTLEKIRDDISEILNNEGINQELLCG